MSGPMSVGILIGLAVLSLFVAMRRFTPRHDPMEDRLREYGLTEYVRRGKAKGEWQKRQRFAGMEHLLHGFGMGDKLNAMLVKADMPLTAGEYAFIMLALGTVGFLAGAARANALLGAVLGGVLALLPIAYLKMRQASRRRAFTDQLPDVLTLLVGSLRAGYGLTQAIELVAQEVAAPVSTEFARVTRAMSLGLPLQRALEDMAARVESDDLDLVVTAINVQYEMGGNLSVVLETISDTIRERVRVLREVQVLTAQQRLTGTILALLPVGLAIAIGLMRPGYFEPFWEPGWPRFLPMGAGVLMVIGFFLIRKIVDIKV